MCAAVLLGCCAAHATHAERIDYFYVESNEGGSSGGHAAIGFGDATYHFQYAPSGFLEMSRLRTSDFLTEYSLLRNRGIHVSRIAVSAETAAALRRTFDRRYLDQRRELRELAALDRRVARLEAAPAGVRVPIRGAGFFRAGGTQSQPVQQLRQRIERVYGPGAVTRMLASHSSQLTLVGLLAGDAEAEDRLEAGEVLGILRAASGLRRDLVRSDAGPNSLLTEAEAATLDRIADSLESRLVVLFGADVPAWGTSFAVGMARLSVLRESVEGRRLVFLDTFPEDAPRLAPRGSGWVDAGPQLQAHRTEWFEAVKSRLLVADSFDEPAYARLEDAANRMLELRRGVLHGEPMRLARDALKPMRSRPSAVLEMSESALAALPAELDRARDLEARARDRLDGLYGYHVVDHNCVSAIFETLDVGLADLAGSSQAEIVAAESRRRLGGRVSPGASLAFIPFVSSRAVREAFDVPETFFVASDRSRKLADMRTDTNPLWLHLRESNVLTSTIYNGGHDDSLFLFFTEDLVATRPLYGAFNLLTGLGGTAAGLFAAPFDRGGLLMKGLKGMLVSLPELAFFNIRKGSNDYVVGVAPASAPSITPSGENPRRRDRTERVADAGFPPGSRVTRPAAGRSD